MSGCCYDEDSAHCEDCLYTHCTDYHDQRPGATSGDRCLAMGGCCYDQDSDHCEECPESGGGDNDESGEDDVIDTLEKLKAWCNESVDNCKVCKGKDQDNG